MNQKYMAPPDFDSLIEYGWRHVKLLLSHSMRLMKAKDSNPVEPLSASLPAQDIEPFGKHLDETRPPNAMDVDVILRALQTHG